VTYFVGFAVELAGGLAVELAGGLAVLTGVGVAVLVTSFDAGVEPPSTPSRPPVPSPPRTVCAL
jgi:hypothetical protein